ncbi:MAG: hypothetical protein AAF943_12960 [Pseudomonadota bacterium]
MVFTRFVSRFRRFRRNEDGSVAMEAMIILPALFWAFLVCFSIFDTFRMYNINQKAAYTIGDAITRETVPIDSAYLNGMRDMFEYLAMSPGESSLRISSMIWSEVDDRYYATWSRAVGSRGPLSDDDIVALRDRLPTMPDLEQVVLVETWTNYDPPFKTGLEEQVIENFVFTRPRFAPFVCWDSCDNMQQVLENITPVETY